MRADRLLAEILILQRRGRVTAAELATELEVSERTIHRDVYALRVAGVPVVTERGTGGGISILGRWRTDLSGLTGRELASLALMAAVSPVGRIDDSVRTALAKLGSILPDHLRPDLTPILLDIDPGSPEAGEAHLVGRLEAAVRSRRRVILTLHRAFDTLVTREADPRGLVFGGGSWHLVWSADDGRVRVDPLTSVKAAEDGGDAGPVPEDFDLASFWEAHRATRLQRTRAYAVRAAVADAALPHLHAHLRGRVPGEDGSSQVELGFDTFEQARSAMLSLGGAIEVLFPEALRRSVADFAEQIRARYSERR